MSQDDDIQAEEEAPAELTPEQRRLRRKRLLIGAALAAIPIAAVPAVIALYKASEDKNRDLGKELTYDDSAFRQVDPKLIKFSQVDRIDVGLKSARAIALDRQGRLLVAGDGTLRIINVSATQPAAGIPEIKLDDTPICIASGADGSIYLGMRDHVEVYSQDGSRKASWPSPGPRAHVTSIAVSGADVWVADAGRRLVVRYTLDGKAQLEIGKKDDAVRYPGLVVPSPHMDVAVDAAGLLWVANPGMHRLEAFRRDGTLQKFWGRPGGQIDGFFGCCNPCDFILMPDGSFVTAEKGLARVKRYSPDGTFQSVVAAPSVFGDNLLGLDLAADAAGRVYVLNTGTRFVHVFAPIDGGGS